MIKVKDIYDFLNEIAPFDTQEQWDNSGLVVGSADSEVTAVGICLDGTDEILNEAKEKGVELIITHHPVIFSPQKTFTDGDFAFECAKNGISVISTHTCFDCADGGVNDYLCSILEIKNPHGIPTKDCSVPMARIGEVEETSAEAFAKKVAERLDTVCSLVDSGKRVKKVAVCGGAGMDFLSAAAETGADFYLTGEMKYHEALFAQKIGISVAAAGHFETENPSMTVLRERLKEKFPSLSCALLNQKRTIKYIG